MDKSTIGGIILALAGILAGLILEGGKIAQIIQPTAAMIVLGGTIGAVMIQFPLSDRVRRRQGPGPSLPRSWTGTRRPDQRTGGYANRARKEGVVSLDAQFPRSRIHSSRKL